MDLDALLQSHGEESPSGEDLEYDAVFTEMEIAAQPGEERQEGDVIHAGEDPDYKEVVAKATEVLQRSHDLRAAVFLAEAQLKLKGLPEFAKCTTYIRRCLEEHWETCHPQLDEEDDNDPTMRINAVFALADASRTIRNLRAAPLTQSRMFGAFSLRDFDLADGNVQPVNPEEQIPDKSAIFAAFEDTDDEILAANLEGAETALADVDAMNEVFSNQTPGQGPDLEQLGRILKLLVARLREGKGEEPVEEADAEGEEGDAVAAMAQRGGGGGGNINSPQDVTAALERIILYYERHEPSSPVPFLLQRAKKLVNADFMTIILDMAPNAGSHVKMIGGIEEEQY